MEEEVDADKEKRTSGEYNKKKEESPTVIFNGGQQIPIVPLIPFPPRLQKSKLDK